MNACSVVQNVGVLKICIVRQVPCRRRDRQHGVERSQLDPPF